MKYSDREIRETLSSIPLRRRAAFPKNIESLERGNSLLHYFVAKQDFERSSMLLLLGADPTAVNDKGETPLQLAKANRDWLNVLALLKINNVNSHESAKVKIK